MEKRTFSVGKGKETHERRDPSLCTQKRDKDRQATSTTPHRPKEDCSAPPHSVLIRLLLQLMRRLLVDVALRPGRREALPDGHIGLGLGQ